MNQMSQSEESDAGIAPHEAEGGAKLPWLSPEIQPATDLSLMEMTQQMQNETALRSIRPQSQACSTNANRRPFSHS